MKNCVVLVLVVLALLLLVETESRRRHGRDRMGRRHRQRDGHSGHGRWSDFMRHYGRGYGRRYGYDYRRHRDWWEGPNVCRSENSENNTAQDMDIISHHHKTAFQICEESKSAYKCTTTVRSSEGEMTKVETFECCHGYSRNPGEFGCPERLRLSNLASTARSLGLNDFLTAVRTVGLDEELARGNFTLFAPVDGSFPLPSGPGFTLSDRRTALMVSRPMMDKLEDDLQATLLGHLLPEPRRAVSFKDEELLETGSPYGSSVRINFYSRPDKLTTANCVRVTSTDNMASNGVIHIVEKVLPTVTSSIMDLVQRDENFSFLKTALARANLVSTFQAEGKFTVFAPTNAAFQSLDQRLLDRLLRGDPRCLEKVLKQHVLPHVICSAVIQGRAKSRNILNNYVNLTRTDDKKVFVNDAQVVRADIMATNGVIHVIDSVLVPDDALDLLSVAQKNDLSELINLASVAGITSMLQQAVNVTVFAPSNQAIQALPGDLVQQLTSGDRALLQSVLNYHVVPEELQCLHMYNNRLLDTLNGDSKIRINEYTSFPFGSHYVMTAQCSPIIVKDVQSCNAIMHVLDKVMLPPTGNVVDVLAANSDYSTLVRLVKNAGLADSLQEEGPFTIFAPTNKAFNQLSRETLRNLEQDREQLADILKLHVIQENLCCAGIFHNPWWRHQRMRTLSGRSLFLSRDRRDEPRVNDVMISSCDNTANNGVVHGVDSVLMARPDPWYMFP